MLAVGAFSGEPAADRYDKAEVDLPQIQADGTVSVSVRVTNTGKLAGDEVVQLYLTHPGVEGAPIRALTGFQRIHLEPGASQTVKLSLHDRDLSVVNAEGGHRIVPGDVKVWISGGQPVNGPGQPPSTGTEATSRVTSGAALPE